MFEISEGWGVEPASYFANPHGYHFSVNLEMSGISSKDSEKSVNLCSQGTLIVTAQRNNLPVLHSYCSSFFMRDARGEFGLINVHLFDVLPAISS